MNGPTPTTPATSPGPLPSPAGSSSEPEVAGLKVRPAWPVALYALLVASAAFALYAERAPVDPLIGRIAPWTFLVFAVGFAVYRLALVAARRYSAFKALFQVFTAAMFFLLLLAPGRATPEAPGLLGHPDAAVRALAAKVIGLEQDQSQARALLPLLSDSTLEVRDAAHQALVRLNGGVDLGRDPSAWKEQYK